MCNVVLRQYTCDELMRPFSDNRPVTDDEFEQLMAPTNFDEAEHV